MIFKHEGEQDGVIVGPLWHFTRGKLVNYRDSGHVIGGTMLADWFTLSQARKIARKLGATLEER